MNQLVSAFLLALMLSGGVSFTGKVQHKGKVSTGGGTVTPINPFVTPALPNSTPSQITPPALSGTTRYVCNVSCSSPSYATLALADAAASCGDTIVITAGDSFTGTTVLTHACPDWAHGIIIKTSSGAIPGNGVRVTSSDSAAMPLLQSGTNGTSTIRFGPSAAFYYIYGLELSVTNGACASDFNNAIVSVGASETTYATQANNIVIDRSYIHQPSGCGANKGVRRAVALNGATLTVINSYIYPIYQVSSGDTNCVYSTNGPGPFLISNNYLACGGENILFGGAAPTVPYNIPSDITITRNYIYKPHTWNVLDPSYIGTPVAAKNLIELKLAQRVLIEGNVMEDSYEDAQVGNCVVLTPRVQGGYSNAAVTDVTVQWNIIAHCGSGFNMSGEDTDEVAPCCALRGYRWWATQNLIYDINNRAASDGTGAGTGANKRGTTIVNAPLNVTFTHNTILGNGSMTFCDPSSGSQAINPGALASLYYQDNLWAAGTGGFASSGQSQGTNSLNACSTYTFTNNVLAVPSVAIGNYPAGNFGPSSYGVGQVDMTDFSNCNKTTFTAVMLSNCALAVTSQFASGGAHPASDGTDMGANMTTLATKVSGVRP